MIQAVVIDLDDTLSLTEVVSFEIENDILHAMGRPPMSREVHLKTWEMRPVEALPIRCPGIDIELFLIQYYERLAEYEKKNRFDVIPKANYDALDALRAQNKSLYILTSRNQAKLLHLLESTHPLGSRIKAFYYPENTTFRKPDPRVFDLFFRDWGFTPECCVYVGDSLHDAKAANGAGLHFIASLESGLRRRSDFDGLPVDGFIDTFPEIVSAVQKLDGGKSVES